MGCTLTDRAAEWVRLVSKSGSFPRRRRRAASVLRWSDSRCRRRGKPAGRCAAPYTEASVPHSRFRAFHLEPEESRSETGLRRTEAEGAGRSAWPPASAASDPIRETKRSGSKRRPETGWKATETSGWKRFRRRRTDFRRNRCPGTCRRRLPTPR